MSLELAFKAVIVAEGNEPQATHDLQVLSSTADLTYTEYQKDLLHILSEAIIWSGRYPVPKTRKYLDTYKHMCYKALYEEQPLGKLKAMHPNNALNWSSFQDLWEIAYDRYSAFDF